MSSFELDLSGLADAAVFLSEKLGFRRAQRQLDEQGRVECTLRAASVQVFGIGHDLVHGEATLSRGRLHFAPSGRAGVGIAIEVTRVDGSHDLRSEGKEPWLQTSPELIVWRLATPRGVLEWGVHLKFMYAAAAQLAPSVS